MSEEEESKRRRQLEDSNATALFDDNLQMYVVPVVLFLHLNVHGLIRCYWVVG